MLEEKELMVVKRDSRRENFSKEKLASGINKAIEKRPVPRPVIEDTFKYNRRRSNGFCRRKP